MATIDNSGEKIAGSEHGSHKHGQGNRLMDFTATTTTHDDNSDTMDIDSGGSSCATADTTDVNGASAVAGIVDAVMVDEQPRSEDDIHSSADADFVWSEDESEDNHLWPVGVDADYLMIHGDTTTIPAIDRQAMAILIQEIMQDLGAPIGRGESWQMTKNALCALHIVAEDYVSAIFNSADLVRQASGDAEMQSTDLQTALQIIDRWSNTRFNFD